MRQGGFAAASPSFWHRYPRLQRPTTRCHHCLCMTSLPAVPIPARIREDPSFSPDLHRRTVRNLPIFWVKVSFRSLSQGEQKIKREHFCHINSAILRAFFVTGCCLFPQKTALVQSPLDSPNLHEFLRKLPMANCGL